MNKKGLKTKVKIEINIDEELPIINYKVTSPKTKIKIDIIKKRVRDSSVNKNSLF